MTDVDNYSLKKRKKKLKDRWSIMVRLEDSSWMTRTTRFESFHLIDSWMLADVAQLGDLWPHTVHPIPPPLPSILRQFETLCVPTSLHPPTSHGRYTLWVQLFNLFSFSFLVYTLTCYNRIMIDRIEAITQPFEQLILYMKIR